MQADSCSAPKRVRLDQHNSDGDTDSASDRDHWSDDDVVHEMKMELKQDKNIETKRNDSNSNNNGNNNRDNNINNNNVQRDWIARIQAIFAVWMNRNELAAFSLLLNFLNMLIKVPLSISWANGIIVANKLRNKQASDACAGWDDTLILSTLLTAILSFCLFYFKENIAQFYAPKNKQHEIHLAMMIVLNLILHLWYFVQM